MNELDRYLDDLGDQFAGAKRPLRRWPAAIVVGAVALVAALVLSLSGTDRPAAPVDAVAAARAALVVPNGQMLHARVRHHFDVPEGVSVGAGMPGIEEVWSAQNPQRWRIRSEAARNDDVFEYAYGSGVSSRYSAQSDRLVRIRGYRDNLPQTRAPSLFGQSGSPENDLRAMLDKGTLVDRGERVVHGRTVRRLVYDQDLLVVTYDLDPRTFAPVAGARTYYRRSGGKREFTARATFTVEVFERVPVDERALSIQPGPDTRVVTCRVKAVTERPTGCRAS